MIVRPSPRTVAAAKREIAHRYRKHAKDKGHKRSRSIAAWRVAELTRLFDDRHGKVLLPDNEDGELGARIMVHHLGALSDAPRRISAWLQCCTPWLGMASRERLIRDALERRIHWKADKLAWKLKVTAAERDRLKLRTIGAMDQTPHERAAIQRERKRERDRKRRRAKGAKLRAEYLAEVASAKPWQAAGVSRATWFRLHRTSP